MSQKNTSKTPGIALIIIALIVTTVAKAFAQSNLITPAEYLASQPKPVFKPNTLLPKNSRWSWTIGTNTSIELARNWGYTLFLGTGSDLDMTNALANPNSEQSLFVKLASNNPSVFRLSMGVRQQFVYNLANDYYVTNAAGQYINGDGTTNATPSILSPESPMQLWTNNAQAWALPVQMVQSNCNNTLDIILNGGEAGLPMAIANYYKGWAKDPRVIAATNTSPWNTPVYQTNTTLLWMHYSGARYTAQYAPLTTLIRNAVPNRRLYVTYISALENCRLNFWYSDASNYLYNWSSPWNNTSYFINVMQDIPGAESYYSHFNHGYLQNPKWSVVNPDMLTKQLNFVGAQIHLGVTTNYGWISGGYGGDSPGVFDLAYMGDTNLVMTNWMGYLKSYYVAGGVGGVLGWYGSLHPDNSSFDPTNPPYWLRQYIAFGRVRALMSWQDTNILNGDLLPGNGKHQYSRDQPSYEFTNNLANWNIRTLARKNRSANTWLISCWAPDGTFTNGISETNVMVNIPNLGTMNLLARPSGAVYVANLTSTATNLTLLDTNGVLPTEWMASTHSLDPPPNFRVGK